MIVVLEALIALVVSEATIVAPVPGRLITPLSNIGRGLDWSCNADGSICILAASFAKYLQCLPKADKCEKNGRELHDCGVVVVSSCRCLLSLIEYED
jgi:hypothetical protein